MAYTDEVVEKAQGELARRRSEAAYRTEQHRAEISEKFPESTELMRDIAGTAREIARACKSRDKDEIVRKMGQLRDKNLRAQQRLADILRAGGYPPDYLDEQYTCRLCGDTGTYENRVCECTKKLLRQYAFDSIAGESPYRLTTFDGFDLSYYPKDQFLGGESVYDHMTKVFGYCKKYAQTFGPKSKSVFMTGQTGLGKTHLSLAIAREVTVRGNAVLYNSFQNFASACENEKFGRADGNTEEILLDCDLLILDDVGSEFSTNFTKSLLYNIINTRTLQCKPTIISTNLTLQEFENAYSGRVFSRINGEFDKLLFAGNDIRQIRNRRG